MGTYARETSVSPEKSRMEIEQTLMRYGATSFGYMTSDAEGKAAVQFECRGRRIRFVVPLPSVEEFRKTAPTRARRAVVRTNEQAMKARDQALRQRWRALLLLIKAKLEGVESGIVSFEQEFAPNTLLPSGETLGEWAEPQLREVYEGGGMPRLLIG